MKVPKKYRDDTWGVRTKTPTSVDNAAVTVNGDEGLRVVAGLLGHADIKTTFGYAHLAEGSVFDAANRVSRGLADMLDGGEAGR